MQAGEVNRITANSRPRWAIFARKHSWALAALLLVTVLLGANSKLLLNGRAAPLWDATDLFAPYFTLIADHARAGKILLWSLGRAGARRLPPTLSLAVFPLSQLLLAPSREAPKPVLEFIGC